jgi:hypothetical protein
VGGAREISYYLNFFHQQTRRRKTKPVTVFDCVYVVENLKPQENHINHT